MHLENGCAPQKGNTPKIIAPNKGLPEIRNCEYCGEEFMTLERNTRRHCSRRCASLNCCNPPRGENHYNWQGGTPKQKDSRLERWGKIIRKRDGFACRDCGSMDKPQAHHIFPKANFSEFKYELWNGVTLCKTCHIKTYSCDSAELKW